MIYVHNDKRKRWKRFLLYRQIQSKIDEKKCDVIFNIISTLDNTFDQSVTKHLSRNKTLNIFNPV